MPHKVKQFDRHIESVIAATELLNCFLHTPRMSLKELVEQSNMTRNRVSRLVGTLLYAGYVMESEEKGTFTTGPKLMALGNVFTANQSLLAVARETLKSLTLTTGESATFYVREGRERVVMAREEGTSPIRYTVGVGQRMDLHAGAAGKVLLSYLPEKEREVILYGNPLVEHTHATITHPDLLIADLGQIRNQGYGISRGERDPDAFSLAAPVFERGSQLLGAIAIAGPISRLTPEREQPYIHALLAAASSFSAKFST